MKRYLLIGFATLIICSLNGCASTSKASSEKSAAAKEFQIPSDMGVVYLYRLGRAVGAAGTTSVQVDGKDAGAMGPGTFYRWELPAGGYVFSCKTSESSATVEINVEVGKHYFISQNVRMGLQDSRVTMKEVDEKTGKKMVSGYKLLVSTYRP